MKFVTGSILTCSVLLSGCLSSGGGSSGDNSSPSIEGNPASFARVNKEYVFTPSAEDADGDALSFSVTDLPDWASFDTADGTISGSPQVEDYGEQPNIVISVSDGIDSASVSFSVDVLPAMLGRENFETVGTVTPTVDGFQSQGTLVMNVNGLETRFEQSDLQLTFDAEGNLVEMIGETIVPPSVSDNVSIDAQVKTTVGYFSGKEINANEDFDITLKDEINYFVYYFSESLNITLGRRDSSNAFDSLTLDLPSNGKLLFITDPTDVFFYFYAAVPFVGEKGFGLSQNGFIPFVPSLEFTQLHSFDGHSIEKESFSLGIKAFDLLNFSGTRVIQQVDLRKIDLSDPLHSPIDYKMGINADLDFALSVLDVGLFSFDLAQASASLEVGPERQQLAMQTIISPDVSWVPAWFPLVPAQETIGEFFVNGEGEFDATLETTFESRLPQASMTGRMEIDNTGATLKANVEVAGKTLGVRGAFFNNGMRADVDVDLDFHNQIASTVTAALHDRLNELDSVFDDLQKAIGDYELELSLHGIRTALPVIADTAISLLNSIPNTVHSSVYNTIVDAIREIEKCTFLGCVGVAGLVNEGNIANGFADTAAFTFRQAVNPVITAMTNLKRVANIADEEVFAAAIKNALQQVYDRRNISININFSYKFPSPFGRFTVFNHTFSYGILPGDVAGKIKFALDNVTNIALTRGIKIKAQDLFDAAPVITGALNKALDKVEEGVAIIPTLDSVGYTVEGGNYSAHATLDGQQFAVGFNVLSPVELAKGIGNLISKQMVP